MTVAYKVGPQGAEIGVGAYSLREAALLIHIPYGKLRRWATGYWFTTTDEERFSQPVVPGDTDEIEERVLSFYELMELFVVRFFRSEGVSMAVVRLARQRAQAIFASDYPFATEALSTDGRGIFADLPDVEDFKSSQLKIELSKGQLTYRELVEPFFRTKVDYSGGLATTYWPLGREKPVMLDAHRAFGQPILRRSGTPTFVLYAMAQAGERLDRIASWYDISINELDAAIEYETSLRAVA